MKKLAILLALLLPTLASAQTVPPPFTTQGAVPTITQWTNAWAGKLDVGIVNRTDLYSAVGIAFGAGNYGIAGRATDLSFENTAGTPLVTLRGVDFNAAGTGVPSLLMAGTGTFGWVAPGSDPLIGGPFETGLFRSALGVVSQRASPSTTPTAFRVYNTYTDASNGEWGALDWQTTPNVLTIGTQANGTGTARNWQLVSGGTNVLDYGVTVAGALTTSGSSGIIGYGKLLGTVTYPWGVTYSGSFVSAFASGGTTITGAGGTCATSTKVGGPTAGTVVLSGVCATGNTIAFTGLPLAPNGFACDAEDRTTRTALFVQSASTTTGFTLTTGAVSSVAGDVLQWKCMGY